MQDTQALLLHLAEISQHVSCKIDADRNELTSLKICEPTVSTSNSTYKSDRKLAQELTHLNTDVISHKVRHCKFQNLLSTNFDLFVLYVFPMSILSYNPCNMIFNYRRPSTKSNHIRSTYLNERIYVQDVSS